MPKVIGGANRVVDHEGLTIDEYAGNVATSDDRISIAHVCVESATSEPWLTLDYDEWICVLKGSMELKYTGSDASSNEVKSIFVKAGETCFIEKGERFRPYFTDNTEYVPVCLPAFRPDRCHREEGGEESDISKNLKMLHSKKASDDDDGKANDEDEVIFHMCQRELWEAAVASGSAYYPPTFEADGFFTHATAVAKRLITTANHFYTGVKGEWICLEMSRSQLYKCGIIVKFEEPMPVGETGVGEEWTTWRCPHIYGGIPVDRGVVTKVYKMMRHADGTFLSIEGIE